jgi:hypothetical protein
MKYESYEEYIKDAKEYYKDHKLSSDLLIISEKQFDLFNGVIEFGPGAKKLCNVKS